jgi:hypothetical protein
VYRYSAAFLGALTTASDALAPLGVSVVDDNKYTHLKLSDFAAQHAQVEEALVGLALLFFHFSPAG